MPRLLDVTALATIASLLAGTAGAEEWKFAIEEIPGSIMDTYAQEFKKRVEEATDGEVTVTIYPLGALGTPTEVVEQAADGVLQFANVSIGNLGTIVPESQIFLLNYILPDDRARLNEILATSPVIYDELGTDFESKGLKLGALYSEGPQVWTTNREIRTPEDFDNFKMRVMVSPVLLQAYSDLGASPTPIPFGEVYGALQLKQVDGQVNPVPAIEEMKFYEVTDYMIWAGEQELVTAVVAGIDWYETLSPDRQALVDETIAGLNDFIVPVVDRFNAEKLEKIKAAKPGIQMIELTTEERAAFRTRAEATHAKVAEVAGDRGAELLDALLAEVGAQ
ncbi:MAG TPA: TRAP transporter substrate-binding protein DctP [Amaricoccus sp.]|uniref:TRAP transporter substrate-binding protein n=1 Tax=Amaricoccus sp. TaxID=1872485 RepID=UPI002C9E92FF|nr:TRAP transporter substrate-binding protein DctP [Amaricoccus sp.]HMQ92650.1 TRAP transporter substrate-binding protein DctP [Amaricoccus sp.]HMR53837.1 TRAP transporter substrate-binding protein DctP [Amaricoccus sp.]HMR61577.1 TRAP transporter substrate-binding protein DctP [Amaricoccus sp.]HMU00832.1 TRAP transporter substrate-binding protein DctP [Amaricoccus sp.]